MKQTHSFHMVMMSPWPLYLGLLTCSAFLGFCMLLLKKMFMWFLLMMFFVIFFWWRDVSRESSLSGFHSSFVMSNMRFGMIFFIVSEILFFLSFFWGFFHSSLSPNIEIGNLWPPLSVDKINPFDIPLLNTIILLSSGVTVTISHHYFMMNKLEKGKIYLFYTIVLGVYFSGAQFFEYKDSSFMLSDSSYSSCFFMATGFHGFHVLVGTLFLLVSMMRMNLMTNYHHIGLESSIWYWHFVDIVWLFLFTFIYWWSY